MNYKSLIYLSVLGGLLSTVEAKPRRLTAVPSNEQCVLVTADTDPGYNIPVSLDVKHYSDSQIDNGQKREVDFTNASGNLHAKMTSLYMQDGGRLSYTYIDGRTFTEEYLFFQFTYYTFKGEQVVEMYKVHAMGDCIVFNSGAELNPGIHPTDQLDVQAFYNTDNPGR